MTVSWRGFRELLRREPWFAEAWSSLTALTWAVLTYLSPDDMDKWPSMALLVRLADDNCWIAIAGFLSGFQLLALMGDYRWMRWAAACSMCWFWGTLTIAVWVAVPWAPGVAVYAGWCGINIFSILRLLRFH